LNKSKQIGDATGEISASFQKQPHPALENARYIQAIILAGGE
jgi:hypothetical protein